MQSILYGKLFNKDGNRKYTNPDASEKLIKYVTRTNGKPDDDLITWGGLGITEYKDIDSIINQFYIVQKMHTRRGSSGRYISHEVFSFEAETEILIHEKKLDIDKIARKMANDFYTIDNCQVIYGVHKPEYEDKHMHIHFAINSVNYRTGNKRRENKSQTNKRNFRFQKIIDNEIKKSDKAALLNRAYNSAE